MVDLKIPSPLLLIWDLKRCLETQLSLKIGVRMYLERDYQDSFSLKIQSSFCDKDPNCAARDELPTDFESIYQKALIEMILLGIKGHSIYPQLVQLEQEMISICQDDIERHLQSLPLKLQIPLLGLIFPAVMIILLLPIVNRLSL